MDEVRLKEDLETLTRALTLIVQEPDHEDNWELRGIAARRIMDFVREFELPLTIRDRRHV